MSVTSLSCAPEEGGELHGVDALLRDPLFQTASHIGLARLIPYVMERKIKAGEYLYRAGEAAIELFFVIEGQAQLFTKKGIELKPTSNRLGEESATDFAHYFCDARAHTDMRVLVLDSMRLEPLFAGQSKLKSKFYHSLMQTFAGDHLHDAEAKDAAVQPAQASTDKSGESITGVLGWLVTLVAPLAILFFGRSWGLEQDTLYFLAIFSSTVSMWVFSLVDEYVPGIFALLVTLAMGLVPPQVILSGLSSDGFMLALSVLGLAAVISASGLSYRLLLAVLRYVPHTAFWQNTALLGVGFILTPLIPSINGRVALVSPFLSDMLEILQLRLKGAAANQLAVAAFTGVTLLSAVFLSSKSVNFVIFGLLPDQIQDQYQWMNWLLASAATGFILIVTYAMLAAFMLRGKVQIHLSEQLLERQFSLLGALKKREWAAILGVIIFMLGVVTTSMHRVPSPWLGLAILFGLLLFGALNKNEFREKIDWPFLIYLAGIVGMTSAMNYLGIGQLVASNLPWLGQYMHSNFSLFVLMLAAVIFVVRLAVPISATIVVMATILMPVAVHYGVNPWVVGFIILILGEMWFLPYQCSYYLQFKHLSQGKLYDEKVFLRFNAVSNLAKLVAIYASLPYWKMIGLL